ncbi:hypothetical protein [Mycetocola miduiensis]|uniref:Uncharacterized protein n=1 Tax=Mycetocola miduiensis TaxID=995034 RepID=A0A1I4YDG3_9MICO|nr:hypothetical protein [Mycetocola miduiensis]SFN36064.1 hypothetical protein SAMN05216219_0141 [Mycetocola miduiensis]
MKANDADRALIGSDDAFFDAALGHDSNFTLSLPFQKTPVAADVSDTPSEAETAQLATLLLDDGKEVSAEIAERERISQPVPTVFLPGNKQRSTRSILTIVVSILTVLALVAVGILLAVKSQAATPEQKAFEAYAARQLTVETADRKLTSTFKAIGTAKTDAEALNVATAAALAAVVGVSDETARAAADTARVAMAAAIATITVVDPAETPYVAPDVPAQSSLSLIARGLDEVSAEATRIDDAQAELDAALTAIADARAPFTKSFTAFGKTIPATATSLLAVNPDAGQRWRDAVTAAATAFTTAAKTGSGATELQAYAAAAFALQGENARVLLEREAVEPDEDTNEEEAPRQTPQRPRATTPPSGGSTSPAPPANPEPAPPVDPAPQPEPEQPEIPPIEG